MMDRAAVPPRRIVSPRAVPLPTGNPQGGSVSIGSLPAGSLPTGSLLSGSIPTGCLPTGYLPRTRLDLRWQDWEGFRLVLIEAPAGYGKTVLMASNAGRSGRKACWISRSSPTGLDAPVEAILPQIDSTPEGWNIVIDEVGTTGRSSMAELAFWPAVEALIRRLPPACTIFIASREPVPICTSDLVSLGIAVKIGVPHLAFTREETAALFRSGLPKRLRPSESEVERIAAQTEGWPAGLGLWLHILSRGRPLPVAAAQCGAVREAPDRVGEPDWTSYFAEQVIPQLGPGMERFLMQASILPALRPDICDHVLQISDSQTALDEIEHRNLFIRADPARVDICRSSVGPSPVAARTNICRSLILHPLFREFLERRLRSAVPGAEVRSLRRRAGEKLVQDESWAEAALAYARAGEADSAIEILETHGMALFAAGELDAILRVFTALPPRDYEARPRTLFVLGRIREAQGRWLEAKSSYEQALRRASVPAGATPAAAATAAAGAAGAQTRKRRGRQHRDPAPGLLLDLMIALARIDVRLGRYEAARGRCREALASPLLRPPKTRAARAPGPSPDLRTWARLALTLAGTTADAGGLAEADEQFLRVQTEYRKARFDPGEKQVQYMRAILIQHPGGDLIAARNNMLQVEAFFRAAGDTGLLCHCDTFLSSLALDLGDEPQARELANGTLLQAERIGLRDAEGYCRWILGRCAISRARAGEISDFDEARAHADAAMSIADVLPIPDLRIHSRICLAEIALARGDPGAARVVAAEARDIAHECAMRIAESQSLITLGLCEESPHASWAAAESILREVGARWHLHRLLLLRLYAGAVPRPDTSAAIDELLSGVTEMRHEAILLFHEPRAAAAVLGAAVRAMNRGKHPSDRLSVSSRDAAVPFLLQLGDLAVAELAKGLNEIRKAPDKRDASDFCARIIARIRTPAALSVLTRLRNPSTKIGRMALSATRQTDRGPESPLHIRALGNLQVTVNNRDVTSAGWGSTRAMDVFVFLLVRRFRWVTKGEILAALWPDEPTERALHGLRQALYILRKTLEPDRPSRSPSSCLPVQENKVRLAPGAGSRYDVRRFEQRLKRARELFPEASKKNGDRALRTIRLLQSTRALYGGDFAGELASLDYVEAESKRLRRAWHLATRMLVKLLGQSGRWEEVILVAREGLGRDSTSESLHHHLILALSRTGNDDDALRVCRDYARRIYKELRALPSPRMSRLERRIRAQRNRADGTGR
jgi:DNA-binding SARP family transcriptional activator/tetratricopeptide (TPR) repeat protein